MLPVTRGISFGWKWAFPMGTLMWSRGALGSARTGTGGSLIIFWQAKPNASMETMRPNETRGGLLWKLFVPRNGRLWSEREQPCGLVGEWVESAQIGKDSNSWTVVNQRVCAHEGTVRLNSPNRNPWAASQMKRSLLTSSNTAVVWPPRTTFPFVYLVEQIFEKGVDCVMVYGHMLPRGGSTLCFLSSEDPHKRGSVYPAPPPLFFIQRKMDVKLDERHLWPSLTHIYTSQSKNEIPTILGYITPSRLETLFFDKFTWR